MKALLAEPAKVGEHVSALSESAAPTEPDISPKTVEPATDSDKPAVSIEPTLVDDQFNFNF